MKYFSLFPNSFKRNMVLLILLLLPLFFGYGQLSGSYTIGGTSPHYTTISEAVTDLQTQGVTGSVVFNIRDGNYQEQVTITGPISGTSILNTITFQSESGSAEGVVINFEQGYVPDKHVVGLRNVSNLVIKNLSVETTGRAVVIYEGAENLILTGNKITSQIRADYSESAMGIFMEKVNASNIVIESNTISGGTYGITSSGNSAELITNLSIKNNSILNSAVNGVRMYYTNDLIFSNNDLSSSSTYSSYENFHLYEGSGKLDISDNKFISPRVGVSINYFVASDGIVKNNFISTGSNGMSLGYCDGIKILNNSFNCIGTALNISSANKNFTLLNNNIFSESFALSVGYIERVTTSDYNNLFSTGFALIQYMDGTTYQQVRASLEEWQNVSTFDQNSLNVDPFYVSNNDLHAQNHLLSNAGTPRLEVPWDIDGEPRDQTPSIGADEFTAAVTEPLSGEYHINPEDPTADFQSLTEALDELVLNGFAGPVKFLIADGEYQEQILIPEIATSSVENSLTIESSSGIPENVILQFSSTVKDENFVIHLNNVSYINFKNITVKATGNPYARTVYMTNNLSNIQFENCILESPKVSTANFSSAIYDSNVVEINASQSNSISFIENTFLGGYRGMYFNGSSSGDKVIFRRNSVIDSYYKGVLLENLNSAILEKNEIYSNQYEHFTALELNDCNGRLLIDSNILRGARNGLVINRSQGTFESFISNNFITASSDQPAFLYSGSVLHKIYFNSIRNLGIGIAAAIYADRYANYGNILVKNNIFRAEAGEALLYTNGISIAPNFDYNNYFSSGDYLVNTFQTLAEWKEADISMNVNSLSVDPLFVSSLDLHSQAPELADAGYYYDIVPLDLDGEERDDSPSIGADEFVVIPDQDKDGILDDEDNCILTPNPDQLDTDGDGEGDACDEDDDNDLLADADDCEPLNPEVGIRTWYPDNDEDGFGDANTEGVVQCNPPSLSEPYQVNNLDCNDDDSSINSLAQEIANDGIDQDCDGEDLIILGDEGCSADIWKSRITWCEKYNQQDDFYLTFGITDKKGLGANITLLSSLDGKKGEWGKLAQQATAAILNSCDLQVLYSIAELEIISKVQTVFNDPTSGRNEARALRQELELANNAVCPLNEVVVDREGCSVDYWINSTNKWCSDYSRFSSFYSVFGITNSSRIGEPTLTLLEALQLKGGGFHKLAKEATAALLNACNETVDFPLTVDQILIGTQEIFDGPAYGNKDANDLSSLYAEANNALCPLSSNAQISGALSNNSLPEFNSNATVAPTAYPNPIHEDGFWISFPVQLEGQRITGIVYDYNGRFLIERVFEVGTGGGAQLWKLDHSNWDQGVYLLNLKSESETWQIQLMKNK